MEHKGVVITAGFNRSKPALSIAELLTRNNIPVRGIIVVSPFSLSRARKYLKKRGWRFFYDALIRLSGLDNSGESKSPDYLDDFMRSHDIPTDHTLKEWARINGSRYHSVTSLNSPKVVNILKEVKLSWLIYSGGGILKQPLLKILNGKILNAHQGPLPEIRGMNACEWSVLLGKRLESTIHIISEGIDTGDIILRKPFSIGSCDTLSSLRQKAIVKGIEGITEVAQHNNLEKFTTIENNANHRQCYIMSEILRQLTEKKLDLLKKM